MLWTCACSQVSTDLKFIFHKALPRPLYFNQCNVWLLPRTLLLIGLSTCLTSGVKRYSVLLRSGLSVRRNRVEPYWGREEDVGDCQYSRRDFLSFFWRRRSIPAVGSVASSRHACTRTRRLNNKFLYMKRHSFQCEKQKHVHECTVIPSVIATPKHQ